MKLHKELSRQKWYQMTTVEQMANVGSEIFRTISWRDRDKKLSKAALWRALELFDLTINDPKNSKSLKEICRIRELAGDYFVGENEYESNDEFWQDYFYNFNYAARVTK